MNKPKRYTIDETAQSITVEGAETIPLYSREGFRLISDLWVKVGWDQKHPYTFTWMGRPIIQIPEDLVRIQEVIYSIKPDVVVETGIAHGGSLVLYASMFRAMGKGRVVGVDNEIRPHNRKALEAHELAPLITMIEGSSTAPEIVERVRRELRPGDTTLFILDSCHTYDHVLAELRAYAPMVTPGSYIVATDGSQEYLNETPRAQKEYPSCAGWGKDNPKRAAEDFVRENPLFEIVEPAFRFTESPIDFRITHWPSAFLYRLR
ncbi:MAG: cephalosporin hydroxylase family protein [Elusimicrobia bacterium]|nr:cephalosporin hydroxylase family protein [Elusimicrobiota bacterium]